MELKEKFLIFSIALFIASLLCCNLSRFFRPGPLMICAQSFASGSLISLAFLTYLADAINIYNSNLDYLKYPEHLYIALGVFVLFTLMEHIPGSQSRLSMQDSMNSEGSTRDFSHFLVHHFSTVPSKSHFIISYLFLIANAILMGLALLCSVCCDKKNIYAVFIAYSIAKMVESFTLGLLLQSSQSKLLIFWVLTTIYSIATPITYISFNYPEQKNIGKRAQGILTSISMGFFLYLGILLWRATFLLPFDWRKYELFIVCASFA